MSRHCAILGVVAAVLVLAPTPGLSQSASPRYTFLDKAQVLYVEGPNLLRIKLLDRQRAVSVRLLGVGSPRNRDRVKHLRPEVKGYIERHKVWQAARDFVESAVKHMTIEVWARSWDRYDEKHRLLVYVVVPSGQKDEIDLNGDLIKRGLAFVTRDYVHVTFARYRQFEEEAKRNRRGMWHALPLHQVSSLAR